MSIQYLSPLENPPQHLSRPPAIRQDFLELADIIRAFSFIARHKYRLALGLVLGLCAGVLVVRVSTPIFESSTQLLVVKQRPVRLEARSDAALNPESMSTHVALIGSPWLAESVLSKPRISGLETFAKAKNPQMLLTHSLDVVHENKEDGPYITSNILKISFKGPQPQDCPPVLEEIVSCYQQYLKDSDLDANRKALKVIGDRVAQVQQSLSAKEKEYEEFLATLSEISGYRDSRLWTKTRKAEVNRNLLTLKTRRAEVEARIAVVDQFTPDNSTELNDQLTPLLVKQRLYERTLGESHPSLRSIREQIRLTAEMANKPSSQSALNRAGLAAKTITGLDPVADHLRSLQYELQGITAAEQALQVEWADLEKEAASERLETAELQALELKDTRLRNVIEREQHYYDALKTQLQSVDIGMASGGHQVTTIAPPHLPRQISPNLLLVAALSVLAGLLMGMVYATAAELSDHSFRSTHEIAHALDLPVLGQIPAIESRGFRSRKPAVALPALDPTLCTECRPDSLAAEAYRGLRTLVFFSADDKRSKIIQITSPNSFDGKTTVAANLAITLAHTGKRVLLVDADLRTPRLHKLFAIPNQGGFSSVLSGCTKLDDAVQPSGVSGLSILPCGPINSRSADALATPSLRELFEVLREQYDVVVLDTPPLLAAVDGQILAAQVDRVLLAIRADKNARPVATRAVELLRLSNAKIMGIVLNRAQVHDGLYAFRPTDNQPLLEYQEAPHQLSS